MPSEGLDPCRPDALGNARLIGAGQRNFPGVDGVDRRQRGKQVAWAVVGAVFPAETAGVVTDAGIEQLLKTFRPAQGVRFFE